MSDSQRALQRQPLIDFLEDPKGFMAANIVLPPTSNLNAAQAMGGGEKKSGIFQFSWEKATITGMRNGNACPIYKIVAPASYNSDLPRFMAYYCHYDNDKIFDLMLEDKMDIMLTPSMNGCSFGIGSETDTGGRRVAHANVSRTSSDESGIKQQGTAQASMITTLIPSASVFGPAQYLDTSVQGTTVGVRGTGGWSFFMQVLKRPTSTSYVLDKITDIPC